MISVRTKKDQITQKQMVDSYCWVSKEYTNIHPEIPGERVYFNEKDIPDSFWKDYAIHYVDSQPTNNGMKHVLCVLYPDVVDTSPFVVD